MRMHFILSLTKIEICNDFIVNSIRYVLNKLAVAAIKSCNRHISVKK